MNIQEEGHAPSDLLKSEIARCLNAGGLPVPFVYTNITAKEGEGGNKADSRKVESRKEESRRTDGVRESGGRTRQVTEQARVTHEKAEVKNAEDSVIDQAVKNGDLNAVIEAIEANHSKESIEAIR